MTHGQAPDQSRVNPEWKDAVLHARIFSTLSDGGQVLMPMEETFFASRFGQVRDRFGINWMIVPCRRGKKVVGTGSPPPGSCDFVLEWLARSQQR